MNRSAGIMVFLVLLLALLFIYFIKKSYNDHHTYNDTGIRMVQGQKYLWKLPAMNQEDILRIASEHNISMPVAHVLFSRGYRDRAVIDDFLFGSGEQSVHHASEMKDMQKAVDRILLAIEKHEKILVFGDYDVDGITSCAMMMRCLLPMNADINFYIPHRVKDGYGLSVTAVQKAAAHGYTVIITVDNGITAFDAVEQANKLGIDVIITDHHRPHESVPNAYAIVNPNQRDCPYAFKSLAGVGVTFKLLSLIYEIQNKELPSKVYELLLLGTIADVVPLRDENRFWVRYGLQEVNKQASHSFRVLKENSSITKPEIRASDIAFGIAPQINALGRLEDPRQGVQFLIGSDQNQVQEIGATLHQLNQSRRSIERAILQEIIEKIERKEIDVEKERVILAASNQWPPGVIGLVASRLVAAYARPVLLFHLTAQGVAKGSCRSIPEFNMFDALSSARDYLLQFGGHSLAAGLSLSIDMLPRLKEHLESLMMTQLGSHDLVPTLQLDANAQLADLNKKLVTDLSYLEPFGNGNTVPHFYIPQVSLVGEVQLLKQLHVKCFVFYQGVIKPVIFFNRPELYPILQTMGTETFDLAATVSENYWNDRVNIELIGLDICRMTG